MKRINRYALILITIVLIIFCLAVANVNAQEADNDGRLVTHLGEFIDVSFSRVNDLDERITGIDDADQQDELGDTTDDIDFLVGDLERDLFSAGDMSDRDERPLYVIKRWHGCEFRGSSDWMAAEG